jgi:RNA polymerase sigma-70 factor (ECF subfamily)
MGAGADSESDDAALAARVAAGDRAAYRTLVRRHAGGIHRYATRLVRDPADAEDVTQETFLRLWTKARDYDPVARLTTWLYRIAHNLAVDRLRARGRLQALDNPDVEPAPESQRQTELLESKQRAEALAAALDALPPRQASALALVHLQGMSGAEAAEVLGLSAEALESLLSRGRRGLKARLLATRAIDSRNAS